MLFNNKKIVTEFYPTFLKEDRSFLRKINEMLSDAESHVYIVCPWITLGEELVIPLENALDKNPNLELYLITKLLKKDVFNRIQQLDDVEKWMTIFNGQMYVKYNNNIHSKMIIVDDNEVIVGSSNLTGSGLGSSRDYEGIPQIESNIYTTDEITVEDASAFFGKIWHHESSKTYEDNEYVASCKSCNLSGIFQNYENDFWKIARQEGFQVKNDKISFKGTIAYLDNKKAYLTGKNRKDIAIKVENSHQRFKNSKIGDEIFIRGKIIPKNGISEFQVYIPEKFKDSSKKFKDSSKKFKGTFSNKKLKISDLKMGLKYIKLEATVININNPQKLETRYGIKYLTLIELQDRSGEIVFELWEKNPDNSYEEGENIEIINSYTKEYKGNLRLVLQKNGEIKQRRYE